MRDIYGWRARLGLIYGPSWVMDPEFYAMSPEGVITCTTRASYSGATVDGLTELARNAIDAAKMLGQTQCNAIVFGCTSSSFLNGVEYNNDLIKRLEDASGVPCTTTAAAVVDALRALNIDKVSIATPYTAEIVQRAKNYVESCGIEVCNIRGLDLIYDVDLQARTEQENYLYAKETMSDCAQAIVIFCTALRTVPIMQALEDDVGKPAISANQASFWKVLRLAGVKEKIHGFGSLLEV